MFFDNTFRSNFDVGHTTQGLMAFGAEGGELNYYVLDGPALKDVVKRYADLTGRLPMPPLWALGYNQCRYSYYPDAKVRFIAETFRERNIPADVIWLDIHYQDGYAPFTWDKTWFPDPARLVADLKAEGFRLVTIVDAHIKKQAGMPQADQYRRPIICPQLDGRSTTGPSGRRTPRRTPPQCPDFSKPEARRWWGTLFKPLVDIGIAGIWNDMNEPAVFNNATGTMPLDVRFDNDGKPSDHREIHNVYGLLMTRGTYEGLKALRPDERPFVLTRATYAGGQRYAAQWPGQRPTGQRCGARFTLLGMGPLACRLSAWTSAALRKRHRRSFTRWLQSGLLYPFYRRIRRSHARSGAVSYGVSGRYHRRAIEMRTNCPGDLQRRTIRR